MPEKLLLFDTETNGTDPTKDQVVEAAGALFSVKHASVIAGFSFTFKVDTNAAAPINGISEGLLRDYGAPPGEAWKRVEAWMARADVVAAHNGGFDRSFCPQPLQNLRPWLCTQDDIDWPRFSGSQKLIDICLSHGVGVTNAHRALTDVLLLASLLQRVAEMTDLGALLDKAMRPKRRYKAITGRFDASLNEKLKSHAFRWDPDAKAWWRRLVVDEVPELQGKYPFSIVEWPE